MYGFCITGAVAQTWTSSTIFCSAQVAQMLNLLHNNLPRKPSRYSPDNSPGAADHAASAANLFRHTLCRLPGYTGSDWHVGDEFRATSCYAIPMGAKCSLFS
jgi:hypothetical protein